MADLETKVKISAETPGLTKINTESEKAFNAKRVKELKQATRELQSEFKNLAKTQAELTASLLKTEKGTKAYKDLSQQLKAVRTETDSARKAIDDLNRAVETGAKRRQGFVAGLAQGAGVAQYIPTGPGMMPRMGGAMLGGMARRTAGGLAAPFLQPGIGGFASMLSAIPGIGQGLAGLVQQGAGYWHQAEAFSAARLQNVPYADLTSRGSLVDNPKYAAAQRRLVAAERKMNWISSGQAALQHQGLAPPDTELGQRQRAEMNMQNNIGRLQRAQGAVPGAYAQAAGLRPAANPEIQAARDSKRYKKMLQEAASDAVAARKAMAGMPKKIREDVTGVPGAGFGTEFGFAPEETQQWFGQMMGARGGLSSKAYLQGTVRESMAVSRLFGVSAQTAGGFERMGMPGAGGGGMSLAQAVASGTAQGLSGSQIPEYLQTMVSQGRRMEAQGIKFDPATMTGGAMAMSALGFQGLQASRVSMGLQEAGRGVAARGVQSPMDILWARAAGFRPGGGGASYAEALKNLEGGPSLDVVNNMLGMIKGGAKAGGWSQAEQELRVKRAFGAMNVQIGFGQAGKILSGDLTEEKLAEIKAGVTPGDYVSMARGGARRVGDLAVTAAGRRAEEIRIGSELAGTYTKLDAAGRQAVSTMAGFSGSLEAASGLILKTFTNLDKIVAKMQEGNVDWLVKFIRNPFSVFGGDR